MKNMRPEPGNRSSHPPDGTQAAGAGQGVPDSTFFHTMMSEIVETLGLSPETLPELRFRSENDDYDDRDFSRDVSR
jgi:hypothetical protein